MSADSLSTLPQKPPAKAPVERRKALRVEAEGVQVTVQVGSDSFTGEICDISRGGLRIQVVCTPIVGQKLAVRHSLAGTLTGNCVRQSADEIAVAFEPAESEVERTLQCLALLLGQSAGKGL